MNSQERLKKQKERKAALQRERRARNKNELAKLRALYAFVKERYGSVLKEFEESFYINEEEERFNVREDSQISGTEDTNMPSQSTEPINMVLPASPPNTDSTNTNFSLFDDLFEELPSIDLDSFLF